jgi:hypothetical protein
MTRTPCATPALPHVEIKLRLPPLSGEQALLLTNVLDDLIAALWNVHGEAMLDQMADLELREHDVGDGRLRVELDAYGYLWLRVRRRGEPPGV